MPWVPIAIAAASAIGNYLQSRAANKAKSEQEYTSTTTPVEPMQYFDLQQQLIAKAMAKMNATTPLEGYEAGGIGNINNVYRLAQMRNQNNLTSRGLSTSPIAGAMDTNLEMGRAGEIAGFQNTLPLLQRQMQNEDYNQAMALFSARPIGQTVTSSGTYQGPQVSSGGNAISNASSMLAYLYASGALGGGSNSSNVFAPKSTNLGF